MNALYVLAIFLPLAGALAAGLFGRSLGDRGSQLVTCSALILAALLSVIAFIDVGIGHDPRSVELFRWIESGNFEAAWSLRFDTLSAVMMCVVTIVSACVHVYSVGYMSHDASKPRFMAYLSLFTFAMLMLVTADNLVQMFFGWEGVGVCSYLLIGFWYDRPSANAAAMKAFIVNRVGDFGFALGIFGIFLVFDTVSFDTIFGATAQFTDTRLHFLGMDVDALETLCLLLFIGAMGKSAQLGLHTWLPDAMEGPTPVSALIHAATMVTAGVFMVCRLSPIFEYAPAVLSLVTMVGAFTAFFAATVGLTQFDIKRVIAYSTCSQLGYMFFAAGLSAYPAAMFHLTTHAFFKALLFLGAGSVIHAMSDEQDMRKMGGIKSHIKQTYILMWIGSLALAGVGIPGVIGFAGFYSKDMILEVAYGAGSVHGYIAFALGIAAALMTAFYSWRLIFMTFHGQPRADEKVMAHVHESPPIMLWPLYVLAFGAIVSGIGLYSFFVGHHFQEFWGDSIFILPDSHGETIIDHAHHVPFWVKALPVVVTLFGIYLAWRFYIRHTDLPAKTAQAFEGLYKYFDEAYDFLFVRPARWLARQLWQRGDVGIIDRFGPDGVSALAKRAAEAASKLQSGYVYHYAFAMLIGVVALVAWRIIQQGA
ncbi:MAG: NADH-quinone oxidoreductase subunit L [Alphaproteobacteria bacterium]